VVQLAPEIGQRLGVGRLGPQRARDPLAWERRATAVEDEIGDELLLTRAWWTRSRTAIRENTESAEQFELHGPPSTVFSEDIGQCAAMSVS
jgi:hypothetical protein